ncbi:MAG: flagellar motor stator protein MotA [Proteobacteria bacterium]|nr:flagellar motor stator protein MotA [Pseudomonadota bacterium]
MAFIFGFILLIVSIIAGFVGGGGNLLVLLQPFEILIVCGSALAVFIISNPSSVRKQVWRKLGRSMTHPATTREDYLETLNFLFHFMRFMKSNTAAMVERHIETPMNSSIFRTFPGIAANKSAVVFFCDYIRTITMGCDNPYELERIMDEDLQTRYRDLQDVNYSIHRIADALPALGIIGAVLGVINAMSAISADPKILAQRIAAALIGTFVGVFFSYCIISPLGFCVDKHGRDELRLLECIKASIIAYVRGQPPIIAVECARQSIPGPHKPSFIEVERAIKKKKPKG